MSTRSRTIAAFEREVPRLLVKPSPVSASRAPWTIPRLAVIPLFAAACSLDPALGGPHGGGRDRLAPPPAEGSAYAVGRAAVGPTTSAATAPPPASPTTSDDAGAPAAIPTWNLIYTSYFTAGTIGDCPSCHVEMASAGSAYAWLVHQAQLDALADPDASVLSWYGGGMPKNGPSDEPQAVADIDAWSAAGRLDN